MPFAVVRVNPKSKPQRGCQKMAGGSQKTLTPGYSLAALRAWTCSLLSAFLGVIPRPQSFSLPCDYNLARRFSEALSALRMFDPPGTCAAGAPALDGEIYFAASAPRRRAFTDPLPPSGGLCIIHLLMN
jgi:hypothetical protein